MKDRSGAHKRLTSLLNHATGLVVLSELTGAIGIVLAILLGSFLLVLVLDALLAFSATGLLLLDVALLGAVIGGFVFGVRRLRRGMRSRRALARTLESRAGMQGNELINALDLAEAPPVGASEALIDRAVETGDRASVGIPARFVVEGEPLRRAVLAAMVVVIGAVALFMLFPGVFSAVPKRLLNPTGTHPPFTLLD